MEVENEKQGLSSPILDESQIVETTARPAETIKTPRTELRAAITSVGMNYNFD